MPGKNPQLPPPDRIPVSNITVPSWHQHPHRRPPEREHINTLADQLTAKTAPPIIGWGTKGNPPRLYVVDGQARLQAAQKAGIPSIPIIIRRDYPNDRAAWLDSILRNTTPDHATLTRVEAALRLIDYVLDPNKGYRQFRNPYKNALTATADLVRAATRRPNAALDPIAAALGQDLTAADLPSALEHLLQRANSPFATLRSFAANGLPLIESTQRVRGLQRTGQLQPSHAAAITRVLDPDLQNRLVDITLKRDLSARELRRYAQHANQHHNLDVPDRSLASDRAIARDLSQQLEDYDQLPATTRRRARRALRDLHTALHGDNNRPQ